MAMWDCLTTFSDFIKDKAQICTDDSVNDVFSRSAKWEAYY